MAAKQVMPAFASHATRKGASFPASSVDRERTDCPMPRCPYSALQRKTGAVPKPAHAVPAHPPQDSGWQNQRRGKPYSRACFPARESTPTVAVLRLSGSKALSGSTGVSPQGSKQPYGHQSPRRAFALPPASIVGMSGWGELPAVSNTLWQARSTHRPRAEAETLPS